MKSRPYLEEDNNERSYKTKKVEDLYPLRSISDQKTSSFLRYHPQIQKEKAWIWINPFSDSFIHHHHFQRIFFTKGSLFLEDITDIFNGFQKFVLNREVGNTGFSVLNSKSHSILFHKPALEKHNKGGENFMKMESVFDRSDDVVAEKIPPPPPLPVPSTSYRKRSEMNISSSKIRRHGCVPTTIQESWDRLFDEGYRADVSIETENGGIIYAHSSILGMASPVLRNMLKESKKRGRKRSISILGVPHDAVQVFIRFLYSSCYEREDMKDFSLHLLVLSHVYVVPLLKQECERQIEDGLLTTENVVDIIQLALLCDAPRLSVICHRMITKNYKSVSATEGWTAMKESHPVLENRLRRFVTYANNRQKEMIKMKNERMVYLELCEAMEALVHICRDGCRTIGPHGKDFKPNEDPCKFAACKGLESLVRHFAGCKLRVPGGCIHCKRMWQLLVLHSRLCADFNACGVPLCRNFKERSRKQSKKEETKWTILVKNILRANSFSGRPLFSWANDYSS